MIKKKKIALTVQLDQYNLLIQSVLSYWDFRESEILKQHGAAMSE